jgi:hypothetical protein
MVTYTHKNKTDVNSNETYEIMNVIGLESALTPNSDSGNF